MRPPTTRSLPSLLPLRLLLVVLLGFGAWLAWRYREQPLLEANAFRQTQTALTAYWLAQDGFRLAYETPVAGAPWAFPFEFPAYQWLAALLHRGTGLSLDAAGRLLSFAFLVACLGPARMLQRDLALPRGSGWVFGALLLSSPLHLLIGRSFQIETAALFFTFAFVAFAVRLIREPTHFTPAALAGGCLALGLLQKATTGLPTLGVLALCWLAAHWRQALEPRAHFRTLGAAGVAFVLPFAVSLAWTRYAEEVRSLNALGPYAEGSNLTAWIFGSLRQHFSPTVLREVVWTRMLAGNGAGLASAAVLAWALGLARDRHVVRLVALCLVLALLPILVFTNVHFLHPYYQVSCLLFLLAAVAIAVAQLARVSRAPGWVLAGFAVAVSAWNLRTFEREHGGTVRRIYTRENHPTLAIAGFLKERMPRASGFVAFGHDWSSELAYYSERKSFTVPWFFGNFRHVWEQPEAYLGGLPLGAVVVGLTPESPPLDLDERLRTLPDFTRHQVSWCEVLLRAPSAESTSPRAPSR